MDNNRENKEEKRPVERKVERVKTTNITYDDGSTEQIVVTNQRTCSDPLDEDC